MANISDLYSTIRPMIVAPILDASLGEAILWSARDFMRKSRWCRESISVTVEANVDFYPLTPSNTDTLVFQIQAAQFGGSYLDAAAMEDIAPGSVGWYFFDPPNNIILSWLPQNTDVGTQFLVRTVLIAKTTATTLPDSLVEQWLQAIAAGALARLLMQKSAPWYDAEAAAQWDAQYKEELYVAIMEAERQAKAYAYSVAS